MSSDGPLDNLINQVAETLVTSDVSFEAVGKIQPIFDDMLWEAADSPLATAIEAVIKYLVEVPKEGDAQDVFRVLNQTVSSMQSVLSGASASFPKELGLLQASEEQQAVEANDLDELPPLPDFADENMFAEFIQRQLDETNQVEALLLNLEKEDNEEDRAQLKRYFHTLKGEAALLGLTDMEELCHVIEDTLSDPCSAELCEILFSTRDWIGVALESYSQKKGAPTPAKELINSINSLTQQSSVNSLESESEQAVAQDEDNDQSEEKEIAAPSSDTEASPAATQNQDDLEPVSDEIHLREDDLDMLKDFVPEALENVSQAEVQMLELETDVENPETLNGVFRTFHTVKGTASFLSLTDIQRLAHRAEDLLDQIRQKHLELTGSAIDVILESIDVLKVLIQKVASSLEDGSPLKSHENLPVLLRRIQRVMSGETESTDTPQPQKLGEMLVESGIASEEAVKTALIRQQLEGGRVGEHLVKENQASAKEIAQALREQKKQIQIKESIKVDSERLNKLIDAIGELVIAESMVNDLISSEIQSEQSRLRQQMGHINKIVRELQEMGTSLRMVPIRPVFQKMARLIRDLSKKMDKEVDFVMLGEDTMLDKTVVDQIGDPLVHMVRNSIDHGLEDDPQERVKAGKKKTGRVELRAFHQGGKINIEIEDDGRGLNREAIIEKATKNNLITNADQMSDREIFGLIFEPGFSTAKQITNVSGRGVGMDVVKKTIESLRGQIDIKSEMGKGTVFNLKLPLTMAIIDGMVILVGKDRFIIPTLSVMRSIFIEECENLSLTSRGGTFTLLGNIIPLIRLRDIFSIHENEIDGNRESVVMVVENEGKQAGILIDEILEQQQIVIKPLGTGMENVTGLSGGAIMPDGQVGLILDITGIIQLINQDQSGNLKEGVF